MKNNERQAAVKPAKGPTLGTDHHPKKAAKGKGGAGAKDPAKTKEDRAPTFAEMAKLERAESAPAEIPRPARRPAKSKAVVGNRAAANTKKAKPDSRSVKPAKVEEAKSAVDPVGPGAPESEAGFSSTTQMPPGPKQVKTAHQSQPGHTPAIGPEVAGSSAPMPVKPMPGGKLDNNGPGVPQEASPAETVPETDFGGFAPPGELPGGDSEGGADGEAIDIQADGQASALPLPAPDAIGKSPIRLTVIATGSNEAKRFTAFDLQEGAIFDDLRKDYANASTPVTFTADKLLDWPVEPRWKLLNLLRDLGPVARIQLDDGEPQADVFEAALAAMEGDADVARCTNGRRLAQEAAALFHADMIEAACSRIDKRLKELEVKGIRVGGILKDVGGLVDALAHKPRNDKLVAVVSQIAGAPVAANIMVPTGWKLGPDGIARPGLTETLVAPAPIVIKSLLRDVGDGTESYELAWRRDDEWEAQVVERQVAADSRAVVRLAARGFPVTSNNSSGVVEYIANFEAINASNLPRHRVARQMGWPGNGQFDSFLWGHDDLAVPDPGSPGDPSGAAAGVSFLGSDEGDEQLVQGFHAGGTFVGWRAAMAGLEGGAFPRVGLALYASLAPPMLAIVEAENFILDFSGVTSQGKTTTLRVAASAWGNPKERSVGSALLTWDSTRTGIERASAILNGLPLILDDTKRAKHPSDIAQTLYDVATGRGKNRGSTKGLARVGTWFTVLISSGEAPVTSFTGDGGTRARVLAIWGSPFGAADAATAQVVRALDAGVKANYGHVGPRFVRFLIENRGAWPTWRSWFRESLDAYTAKAAGNPVAGRMASHFAVLELTASLVMEAFDGLFWMTEGQFHDLWEEMTAETPDADPAVRALRQTLDWAMGHQAEFWGRHETQSGHVHQPSGGWAGRWDAGPQWAYLGFLENRLRDVLVAGGFEFEPTVRSWRDRGWLLTNGGHKSKLRAQVGHETTLPWLIAVSHAAIAGLDEGDSA